MKRKKNKTWRQKMNEVIEMILRCAGILLCIGLPAYALLFFDDDNAEM